MECASSRNVNDQKESSDEVDSVLVLNKTTEERDICKSCGKDGPNGEDKVALIQCNNINNNNAIKTMKSSTKNNQLEEIQLKPPRSALKAFNIFSLSKFQKRNENINKDKNGESCQKPIIGQRLIRSTSLAKLLGNGIPILKNSDAKAAALRKSHSVHERFSKRSEDSFENDDSFSYRSLDNENSLSRSVSSLEGHQCNPEISSSKKTNNFDAFKTITRNFGKLLRKNYDSVSITTYDPEYKVSYLGNVLTAWSKGERLTVTHKFDDIF